MYRQTKREELEAETKYSFILIGKGDQPVNPDIITLYSSSLSFFRFLEHTHLRECEDDDDVSKEREREKELK